MRRFLIAGVLCWCAAAPAGEFEGTYKERAYPALSQKWSDFLVDNFYIAQRECREVISSTTPNVKGKKARRVCENFLNELKKCVKAHPKETLRVYTDEENNMRNRRIIECTSITWDWKSIVALIQFDWD